MAPIPAAMEPTTSRLNPGDDVLIPTDVPRLVMLGCAAVVMLPEILVAVIVPMLIKFLLTSITCVLPIDTPATLRLPVPVIFPTFKMFRLASTIVVAPERMLPLAMILPPRTLIVPVMFPILDKFLVLSIRRVPATDTPMVVFI